MIFKVFHINHPSSISSFKEDLKFIVNLVVKRIFESTICSIFEEKSVITYYSYSVTISYLQ